MLTSSKRWPYKVSILVPTFNGRLLLRDNLPLIIKAVKNYKGNFEIIVIDDGSMDGTESFIKSNFPEVKTVRLKNTSGYAAACNYGAGNSGGEVLIFLNNDVKVEACFIEPLIKHFEDESVFAVGASSIIPKQGYINEAISQGYFKKGILVVEYPEKTVKANLFDRPRPILHVCGVAFACRKDRFLELGGFDTIFKPFYWEDVDLSYRAWKRGWHSIYEPKSIVYHQHSSTIRNFYSEDYIKYISWRNRILFYWKNITDPDLVLKHIFWLPWWIARNILREGPGWIKSFGGAMVLLGSIKMRRRKEKMEMIWPDAKVIRLTGKSVSLSNKERADRQFIQAVKNLAHMQRFIDFRNKRCLEIGCHLGGLTTYYALHGVKVEAIDCEQGEPVLEFARDYAQKKEAEISFNYGDVHNLNYADNSFDIIIMDNILEHLADYRKALLECRRVLKKGGLLFMNFSLFYGPFGGHQDSIPWYHLLPERLIRGRLEREGIYGVYKTLNKMTLRGIKNTLKELDFEIIYFHRASALSPKSRDFMREMFRLLGDRDFSGLWRQMKKLRRVTLNEAGSFIFFGLLVPLNFISLVNELTIAGIRCVLKK